MKIFKHSTIHAFLTLAITFSIAGCGAPTIVETPVKNTNRESELMKSRFEEFFAALNEHDIDKAMGFMAGEFQLHFTEMDVRITREQMADVLGWDKGVNGVKSYENLQIGGRTVAGLFTEKNEFFELIGIKQFRADVSFVFDDAGMIVLQTYKPLPNQRSFQDDLQPALAWAREHRPEELAEIYSEKQIQFNYSTAKRWVRLLKDWNNDRIDE